MNDFMTWILSILGVVIIGVILDIFLSDKKLGKLIRNVFASLIILIIVTPLPALFNSKGGCADIFSTDGIQLDDSFLNYANSQKVHALEKGVEDALASDGYKNVDVVIDATIGTSVSIKYVNVYVVTSVIGEQKLNIHNDIKSKISELLSIGTDKIIIFD